MIGRIRWIFFIQALTLSTLEFGLVFSFGALLPVILETFDTDRSTAATVQSLLIGIASCLAVISGILIDKFGLHMVTLVSSILVSSGFAASFFITDVHYLYATISILAGVGIAMIYMSSVTLIGIIFSGKQKYLCLAIHSISVPLSGIFYPYLLDLLVREYGINGTFLVLCGVFCNTFVFSLTIWFRRCDLSQYKEHVHEDDRFSQSDPQTNTQSTTNNVLEYIKELMSKRYVCLLVATGIAVTAVNGYLEFAFDIAEWKGFDESQANMSFVILNISSCIFCIMPGLFKQKLDIDPYFYPFGLALIGMFGSLIVLLSKTYAIYIIGTVLIGATLGTLTSALIICTELVRLNQFGIAVGMLQTVIGILSAATGPLFGIIRDSSGSYNLVFTIICVAKAVAVVLFISDIIIRKLRSDPASDDNIETYE